MKRKVDFADLECSDKVRLSSPPEKEPHQTEQETVRQYCCYRALYRPKTTLFTAIKWGLVAEGLGIAIAFCLWLLFYLLEYYQWLSIRISLWHLYSLGSIIACIACLKRLLITAIELYQHYASENVRRKCILMPTCSEYAILALRKHGLILGLYKIYIRLVKTCRGHVYRIDYP